MGLPVWRAPSPVESKDAIKVDLNAPSRSPIRRRRSPGIPRRARRSGDALAPISGTLQSRRSPRPSNQYLLAVTNILSNGNDPPSHTRPRAAPPPVPESRNYAREHEYDRALVQAAFREDTRPRSFQSPDRERAPTLPPLPSLRSPPRAFGEVSRELPAYTPNFAPAGYSRTRDAQIEEFLDTNVGRLRPTRPSSRPRSRDGERAPLLPSRNEFMIIEESEDDSGDNNAVGFPPLRRMGRRTIADGPLPSSSLRESWSPATTVDGLGDRDRSLSPVDGHWETMLSTVAPDPLPPTADSSFASAAASASFSNSHPSSRSGSSLSNSASSSRTHLTVPSRYESQSRALNQLCDTSDEDTAEDTEPDDIEVHEIRPTGAPSRMRSWITDEPPSRNPFRYSRVLRDRSRDASRFVRNYYSFTSPAGPREDTRANRSPTDDRDIIRRLEAAEDDLAELEQMRSVLERLARRDDIPEEFWISAGLAPPLAERVERLQRERR